MSIKVGINGFGRIGRNFLRASFDDPDIDIVAANDITDAKTLAYLLKYDSVLGIFDADVKTTDDGIIVNDKKIKVLCERDVGSLPWKDLDVSIVIESTGLFRKRPDSRKGRRGPGKQVSGAESGNPRSDNAGACQLRGGHTGRAGFRV